MKKLFTLLLIVSTHFYLFSQAYIDTKLYDDLMMKDRNAYHAVNVFLNQQVNIDSLHNYFRTNNVPVDQRSKIVIRHLTAMAHKTQPSVLGFINQKHRGEVKNLQSFWILNMISLEAPAEVIFDLAERSDISIIELNTQKLKIEQPVKISSATPKAVGAAEPGLLAINAHKLWAMGYTGRNRVGMNVDTGNNFMHPAIKSNYLGLYFPLGQCWFPFNNPEPYDISGHSHGTHTCGTMMGLDPATADTIGVAFHSHWISADPIVSDLYYLRTLPEVMSSFEWALNPDGDTSTVSDIPDVINNSWGWVDAPDTFQCNSPYTAVMDVCEAAGIAVVMSAGNDGDLGAGSVGEPAHKAHNLVNAFAVGSVNGNLASLPISEFSSLGPTLCADTGSLWIKPEVVAPGQDVRSAMGQNEYGLLSGTSMAGPHAAGAVLLLKEAFPFLSGEEIKLALYHTASDLGPTGEDNTYGMGMIDLLAAFNYLATIYVPEPPATNDWELVLDQILVPSEESTCETIFTPEIQFSNQGDSTISSVTIKLLVDKVVIVDTVWTGTLSPGQHTTFQFNQVELLQGYRVVQVEVAIPGLAKELHRFNNFGVREMRVHKDYNLPYLEDFETTNKSFTNSDWFFANPDNNITWKVDTVNGQLNNRQAVYMDFYFYKPDSAQRDDLMSPQFNMPDTGGVNLTFDVAYRKRRSWTNDSLRVFVSTDCGQTYPYLVYDRGGDTLKTYPNNFGYYRFHPYQESDWRKDTVDLSPFVGSGSIMLKFQSLNMAGNSLWVDNIELKAKPGAMSVGNLTVNQFKVYPVPANDNVMVELPMSPIAYTTITLLCTQGQELGSWKMDQRKLQIKLADLSPGVYFVKIESGENTFFKRLVVIR